ncbi:TonB-dependent outer membrane receptor, SusC/RagA subfamily, signature region [bacterium A37T11]|nr:TonB-dependent outer membrane receptor, SusC/RagA subfamily, signature region [bacterium A37T11]
MYVVASLLLFPGLCLAQKVSLHVREQKLEVVLRSIEQQTGFSFFVSQELLDKANPVTLYVADKNMPEVLDSIFIKLPLHYFIMDGTLLISEKPIEPVHLVGAVLPKIRPLIRCRISDISGSPLFGVSVRIDETKRTTCTDSMGLFSLEKVPDNAHIFLSHVGFRTRRIVAYRLPDQVILYFDRTLLPEVPVSTSNGYYQEARVQASSSADVIPYALFNRAVSSDVLDHIDHMTSGVLFNKGDALQTDALLIRGRSSILADARPLIVLDHFPYDGDLRNLNPNDFLEVNILKDAAATSLWGVRAANGVIVLNTRRGTTPTTKITFNSSFSLQGRPDLSTVSRISSADYIELEKQLFSENKYLSAETDHLPTTPVVNLLIARRDGLIDAAVADAQIEALKQVDVRQDVRRYLYQPAFTQRYALDLSGDIPLLNYYLSAGRDQGQESLVGDQQERTTFRSILNFTLTPKLQLYGSILFSSQRNRQGSNAGYGNYEQNGKQLYSYARLTDNVDEEQHQQRVQDVLIQSGTTYTFSPVIQMELHYQFESQTAKLTADSLTSHQGRLQFNLHKHWKKRNALAAHVGMEIKHLTSGTTTDHFLSYFAQASYQLDSSYFLSATLRKDAANLFGAASNKKTAPFWSLGTAYKWCALKFRASYGVSGNIARNASAYTVARMGISALTNLNYLYIVSGPNDQLGWEQTKMGNLGVDVGTKKGIISGSLDYYTKKSDQLVVQSPLDPALGLADIQSNSLYYSNAGSMRGQGLELTLKGQFFKNRLVQWGSSLLLSHHRSTVQKFPSVSVANGQDYLSVNQRAIHPVSGKPLFGVYSYPWKGLDGQYGDPQGIYKGLISSDWKTIVQQTSLAEMTFHGSAVPTWFGSLLNQIQYRQWELSCMLSYQLGYYFRKPALSYSTLLSSWSGHGEYAQRWQHPGDENHTQVPALITESNQYRDQFYQYASANVLRGDHICLEDIKLSYHIHSLRLFVYASNIGLLWKANKATIDPFYNDIPTPACSYSVGLTATL